MRVPTTFLTVAAALCLSGAAQAATYIALGDSITFGETDLRYVPSDGNRGYVDDVAAALARRAGGVRPTVINLAIDGETAQSFLTGFGRTPPVVGRGDLPLALQNSNYSGPIPQSQSATFLQRAAAVTKAGDTIDTVTITLGFNEVAALALLPPDTGLAAIPSTLERYRIVQSAVLAQIRSVAPNAKLYLIGYFNPFPGDNNAMPNPATPIFATAGPQLNAIIRDLATRYNATYVDTATPFTRREAELTFIDEVGNGDTTPPPYSSTDAGLAPLGNVHPTETGYAVIATAVVGETASVSEPAVASLLLLGAGAIAARRRRRTSHLSSPT